MIQTQIHNRIAVISMHLAPVNALGQAMRQALISHLHQAVDDENVSAIVITSSLSLFSGGADIEEFKTGKLWASPNLHDVINVFENAPKLVIAAINGFAMGGGLELALACDYRVARSSSMMGLPEIKLGLFPGAGGTQRLPRVTTLSVALDMILSGNPINGKLAEESFLVDHLVRDDKHFLDAVLHYVEELIRIDAPARCSAEMVVKQTPENEAAISKARGQLLPKLISRFGRFAPTACIDSLERSMSMALEEALAEDAQAFKSLLETAQARGLIHLFFAEREAQKIPGLSRDTVARAISSVAIIGAGTMGVGIAIACLDARFSVTILETSLEALQRGLQSLRIHYDKMADKGRITQAEASTRVQNLVGTLHYDDLSDTDLVIEAVFEDMKVKQVVFQQLDEVCKPSAILASNTSTLDLNAIANLTKRSAAVIGLHFFSPANVMRLLEVVRGEATSPDVIKTVIAFGQRIRKLPVVVEVCDGFVGNRMLEPYFRESSRLLLEGASPEQVDRVLTDFGMAMGIISVSDLAGLDVSYRVRESKRNAVAHDPSYHAIQDRLFELGRYGHKTGRGSYFYEGREKTPDPEVIVLCEQLAQQHGIQRRDISDQEILERCLYPLINEGIQLLDEGIAYRSGDCDLIWVNGYGFPAWRGGPLQYADEMGLAVILSGMQRYHNTLGEYGEIWFKPAALLEKLVGDGQSLKKIDHPAF